MPGMEGVEGHGSPFWGVKGVISYTRLLRKVGVPGIHTRWSHLAGFRNKGFRTARRLFSTMMLSSAKHLAPRARSLCMVPHIPAATGRGTFEMVEPEKELLAENGQNKFSAVITQRKSQGAGQAQLFATDVGKIEGGMNKPQIGIASVWYEGNPCNMHLNDLALQVKVRQRPGVRVCVCVRV